MQYCVKLYGMKVINLSSGSDGNLTYIETENSRILVDMGISCKDAESRLSLLGVDGRSIDAIIVSHEHVDHIKGINVFSKKYSVPVYAHNEVWAGLNDKLDKVKEENKKIFVDSFGIKDLLINPVEVPHDVKCFGYSFVENDKKISILTDLGHTNDKIFNVVKGSSLIYLEANHDLSMLRSCEKYPLTLKMRIAGPNGHLSNEASAQFIEKLVQTGTKQIVLSHLSKENNSPSFAYEYITNQLAQHGLIEGENFKIDVALTRPTTLFKLK